MGAVWILHSCKYYLYMKMGQTKYVNYLPSILASFKWEEYIEREKKLKPIRVFLLKNTLLKMNLGLKSITVAD